MTDADLARQLADAMYDYPPRAAHYADVWAEREAEAARAIAAGWRPLVWQPIETAPKTPKAILVWCPSIRCTFAVTWVRNGRDSGWEFFGSSTRLREVPTHWMPLPEPPEQPEC